MPAGGSREVLLGPQSPPLGKTCKRNPHAYFQRAGPCRYGPGCRLLQGVWCWAQYTSTKHTDTAGVHSDCILQLRQGSTESGIIPSEVSCVCCVTPVFTAVFIATNQKITTLNKWLAWTHAAKVAKQNFQAIIMTSITRLQVMCSQNHRNQSITNTLQITIDPEAQITPVVRAPKQCL